MSDKTQLDKDDNLKEVAKAGYVLATVIKTQGSVSAKPGFKARVSTTGELTGWVGGSCVQRAVKSVALELFKSKQPRLIRIKPGEDVKSDRDSDGVELHKSGCPSKGITDIFLEPVIPNPPIVVFGNSPVANSLIQLCSFFNYEVISPQTALNASDEQELISELKDKLNCHVQDAYFVIATQGAGDKIALQTVLSLPSEYIGFVGSQKKFASLKNKLSNSKDRERLDFVKAPAGLNICAVTPEEIALSILSEIILIRRADPKLQGKVLEDLSDVK